MQEKRRTVDEGEKDIAEPTWVGGAVDCYLLLGAIALYLGFNRLISGRARRRLFVLSGGLLAFVKNILRFDERTAHPPATVAQIPELIAICLVPLVLLNSAPLNAPATTLLLISCLPR